MIKAIFEDQSSENFVKASTPFPREGNSPNVTVAAAFLTSNDASWIAGVPLPVDGGFVGQ